MKKSLILSLITIGFSCEADGFTVSVMNFRELDATAVPILDNTGTPFALGSGYVAVGTFPSMPRGGVDELRSDFIVFGEGQSSFANDLSIPGFFDLSRSASIPSGSSDPPVGKDVYLLIGNGGSLAGSWELIILDTGLQFQAEDASGIGGLEFSLTSDWLTPESIVRGAIFSDADIGEGLIFEQSLSFVFPEPSTIMFEAFSGMFLAARRRRSLV